MQSNRSVPSSTVIPVLYYLDVRQAVDWLSNVFGFKERLQIGENHRSQLSIGENGAVIIGDMRDDRKLPRQNEVTHEVMVRITDLNTHCENARKYGARILKEPADFPYGERQYTAEDLAGHRWIFTETINNINPAEWGGILKQ